MRNLTSLNKGLIGNKILNRENLVLVTGNYNTAALWYCKLKYCSIVILWTEILQHCDIVNWNATLLCYFDSAILHHCHIVNCNTTAMCYCELRYCNTAIILHPCDIGNYNTTVLWYCDSAIPQQCDIVNYNTPPVWYSKLQYRITVI